MELTAEQMDVIQKASRDMDYGEIKIKFAGERGIDIEKTQRVRFHNDDPIPTQSDPQDKKGSGRY
jgi:hypothetical protein